MIRSFFCSRDSFQGETGNRDDQVCARDWSPFSAKKYESRARPLEDRVLHFSRRWMRWPQRSSFKKSQRRRTTTTGNRETQVGCGRKKETPSTKERCARMTAQGYCMFSSAQRAILGNGRHRSNQHSHASRNPQAKNR